MRHPSNFFIVEEVVKRLKDDESERFSGKAHNTTYNIIGLV